MFDDDLWSHNRFDPQRFALWLSLMLEAEEDGLADRWTGLSEDFVVFAFHRRVMVFDLAELTWAAGLCAPADHARIATLLETRPTERGMLRTLSRWSNAEC